MQTITADQKTFPLVRLQKDGKKLLTVAPRQGGRLTEAWLYKDGKCHSILWLASTADLQTNAWYKHTILFPYPNRLKDGKFRFQDVVYQFPINEPHTGNQLHGLLYYAPFTADNSQEQDGVLSVSHSYKGQLPYFPFPFEMKTIYRHQGDRFDVTFEVINTGKNTLPMGLGWHPYFQIDGRSLGEFEFSLPRSSKILVDDRSIPTGGVKHQEAQVLDLAAVQLDTAFELKSLQASHFQYTLMDKQSDLKLNFRVSNTFPYLQLFIPPQREAIAIEPMTCNVNALNTGEGLRHLSPGEAFTGTIEVSLA